MQADNQNNIFNLCGCIPLKYIIDLQFLIYDNHFHWDGQKLDFTYHLSHKNGVKSIAMLTKQGDRE